MSRWMLLVLCAGLALGAEMRMTIEQLKEFVRSSIALHHPDRGVAEYLKKVKLTNQLDGRTVEELQGLGAGPKTVEALNALRDATSSLPAAAPPPPVETPKLPAPPTSEEQAQVLHDAKEY